MLKDSTEFSSKSVPFFLQNVTLLHEKEENHPSKFQEKSHKVACEAKVTLKMLTAPTRVSSIIHRQIGGLKSMSLTIALAFGMVRCCIQTLW
uniref:AP2/ERF domain-containing transcription factor n=1 Tax=Solanum tuberosum TaxID=4113 RepID=M1BL08_SOLTU